MYICVVGHESHRVAHRVAHLVAHLVARHEAYIY